MTVVTKHAKKRLRKRLGLSIKSIQKITDDAFMYGKTHAECKGNAKKYISKLFRSHKQGDNIRIWHEHVFIFCKESLITVLDLPNSIKKCV